MRVLLLRRECVGLFLVVGLSLLLVSTSQAQQQMATSQPGVTGQCANCHEEIVKQYLLTRHGKADRFGVEGYQSCASCHGDVAAHAESGDPSKITNPAKLDPAEASQRCLACHSNQSNRAFWEGGAHEIAQVGCLSCHSVHHAKTAERLLVARSERETCFTCHTDQRKAQTQRSTHLFRDELRREMIQCSDCHNPHGSQTEKMLRANSINDTCFQCHTDKRGPFLWEHPPAQENCLNCHSPHGSNNVSLLTMRAPQLCQNCHIQGKHQTVSGFANSPWVLNRACLNCHTKVHGSNHPSGLKLQR